jgi:alpha-tubulin suppressor-like RCC1 family protein
MRVPSFHAFRSGRVSVAVGTTQLWSWGVNNVGQLGLGNTIDRSSPVQVGALTDWSSISGGMATFSIAIKTNGTLWAWGLNTSGQLGLGNQTSRSSPVQVGALTDWSKISGGYNFTSAIKTDGTLWSLGGVNSFGQLGQNDQYARSSPVQIGALTSWSIISSGSHSLAVKTDGTLWAWGANSRGQCGQGDTTNNKFAPVQIGTGTSWSSAVAGSGFSLAVKTDGTLWSWGVNASGQLGQGDIVNRSSPVQVGALTSWSSKMTASGVGILFGHVLAVKTDGTLWSWGHNGSGSLGQGDVVNRSSPVQVGALTTWNECSCKVIHSYGFGISAAIKTNGTLWTWGRNDFGGALGLSDVVNRSSPVQVGALTTWSSVSTIGNAARNYRGGMLAIRT